MIINGFQSFMLDCTDKFAFYRQKNVNFFINRLHSGSYLLN